MLAAWTRLLLPVLFCHYSDFKPGLHHSKHSDKTTIVLAQSQQDTRVSNLVAILKWITGLEAPRTVASSSHASTAMLSRQWSMQSSQQPAFSLTLPSLSTGTINSLSTMESHRAQVLARTPT